MTSLLATAGAPRPTGAALRARLTALAADVLRVPPATIDAATPLWLHGLDSLGAVELAAAVEDAFGMELPPTLLTERPTIEALALLLESDGQSCAGGAAHRELALMRADSVLEPEIRPPRGRRAHTAVSNILLTGATGFLGAWLLRALLRDTPATVHCLVRTGTGDPLARIRANLERYALWDSRFEPRVRCVEGDLALPALGLSARRHQRLATGIDHIFHVGAAVHWVTPYEGLRAANVGGTRELLRIACVSGIPFHFVSSLATCYATTGPREVSERDEIHDRLEGLHFGYAQSKCVAEALVREAAARGLPATIHRPALLTGDAERGIAPTDDLIASLIKGCIQLGAAPDLDWIMDCVPVDHAADAIARLALERGERLRVFHVANRRSRHWRECVLWMRFAGHALRLVPYAEWLRMLERATRHGENALAALRPFLAARWRGDERITLPELYEEGRRVRANCDATRRALARSGTECPPLDARHLDRLFSRWEAQGFLAPVRRTAASRCTSAETGLMRIVREVLASHFDAPDLRVTALAARAIGGDDSIISELASWQLGRGVGLHRCMVSYADAPHGGGTIELVVKRKPEDERVIEIAESLAEVCDERVGRAVTRWRDRLGFTRGHLRELAIYGLRDERFRRHTPRVLGSVTRPDGDPVWALALEPIGDAVRMGGAGEASDWSEEHVQTAVIGLAELHAVAFGCGDVLPREPWLPPVRTAGSMGEMRELWLALADHAAPRLAEWAGESAAALHRRCAATVDRWWPALEGMPRTLIHNDANPRNLAIRPDGSGGLRLCAYDWELATLGAPQRDLAELLCFTLPSGADAAVAERWLEMHRTALEQSAGVGIARAEWRAGFAAALADFAIDRLGTYALVHRVRAQRFLPRVARTWAALQRAFPPES